MVRTLALSSTRKSQDFLQSGSSRHVSSKFMRESLLSERVKRSSEAELRLLLPDASVVQIGGKLIDGGGVTLMPVIEEIRSNLKTHKMVVAAGSGKRARHVIAVGEDLGLPTGVLAELRRLDTELNSHILGALLAPDGIAELTHAEMVRILPAMLDISHGAVFNSVPPYDLWEQPSPISSITPQTGADMGAFLFADTCGVSDLIYVRDVDGLFTADPKQDSHASLIKNASALELMESGPKTACIDYDVIKVLISSRLVKRILIVNGLKRGRLTAALNGENAGTIITKG